MKKFLKWFGLALLVILVVIQFFRPDRTNPPVDPSQSIWADATVPTGVKNTLRVSCGDCHSNETNWPWYSNIAPVSWLVAHDVKEGREHLNLSDWISWSAKKKGHSAEEIYEEVEHGEMPLGNYTLLHGGAKVSAPQLAELKAWSETLKVEGEE